MLSLDSQASVLVPPVVSSDTEGLEDAPTESEGQEESDVAPSQPPPGRPRKATSIVLSEDVKRKLGEWLEHDVPFVYTKALGWALLYIPGTHHGVHPSLLGVSLMASLRVTCMSQRRGRLSGGRGRQSHGGRGLFSHHLFYLCVNWPSVADRGVSRSDA